MKKFILGLTSALVCGLALVGCTNNTEKPNDGDEPGNGGETSSFDLSKNVMIYTRDTESGTRDGFFTAINLKDAVKDDDVLSKNKVEVSSNGDMMQKVSQDDYAIGYASLSSVLTDDSVKGLNYMGVEATIENVQNGSYKLSRNFNYVVAKDSDMTENETTMVKAFLAFMTSQEGLTIVSANDGILMTDIDSAPEWNELKTTNEDVKQALALTEQNVKVDIHLGGSTSVEKIAEALTAAFAEQVKGFNAIHNHTGSGDAYKNTQGSGANGTSALEIGFLSRELNADETAAEGTYGMICKDGIVAIINPANTSITNVTPEVLVKIFTGEVTRWENL